MANIQKRVLIIFPHNFFEKTSGVNVRFYNFAKYLNNTNFKIDLFTLKNYESKWEKGYPFDHKIVDNLYFYNFSQNYNQNIIAKIFQKFKYLYYQTFNINKLNTIKNLPDYSTPAMKSQLIEIIKKHNYSHIIVGYAYWANLIKNTDTGNSKKVIFIEDWLTVQMKDHFNNNVNTVDLFKDEIDRINLFDYAIELSTFENYLFSQMATIPKHVLVPIFLESNKCIKLKKPEYDIAFIAHNNAYNIEGIKWFISEVVPLIPTIKLIIVGKVNNSIGKLKHQNITQVEYVENLDDVYKDTKLIICPLFGGTGLKVKIVESLSYGTPIICTPQSMVGFPYANENGIYIARNSIEFADQITRLKSNKNILQKESNNALKYFNQYFSLISATKKLDTIFKNK